MPLVENEREAFVCAFSEVTFPSAERTGQSAWRDLLFLLFPFLSISLLFSFFSFSPFVQRKTQCAIFSRWKFPTEHRRGTRARFNKIYASLMKHAFPRRSNNDHVTRETYFNYFHRRVACPPPPSTHLN